jgi:hypothetical protein
VTARSRIGVETDSEPKQNFERTTFRVKPSKVFNGSRLLPADGASYECGRLYRADHRRQVYLSGMVSSGLHSEITESAAHQVKGVSRVLNSVSISK